MARESYVATVLDWRQLLDQLDEKMARSKATKDQVALLGSMHDRAQEIVHERNMLKVSMMALTRELRTVLRTGCAAAHYVRTAAKLEIPPGSPQRKKLGIRTGGRPRGRKKARAPRK